MKIMQVNKYWRVHGTSERYVFELSHMLADRGHEIIPFAMKDEDNEPSRYSTLFVSPVDITDPYRIPVWRWAGIASRILYSKEARNRTAVLADLTHPDVAHLHNIYHHLSPSILTPLKNRGIGTVMTVHDYKLFCPALTHYNEQGVCEKCSPYHYGACVTGRCVKGSRAASALCAAEMLMHDLFNAYLGRIDMFIAPSEFVASRLYARGLDPERVAVIPHAVDTGRWTPGEDDGDGDYVLFLGRLTVEKGILNAIQAFAGLPHIPLRIAGSGGIEGQARTLARELGADNISFLGFQQEAQVRGLLRGCRFLVLPSESYENAPMSVLEAFASGKPAVASRTGGIPEMVREGETGLLSAPGDVEELRQTIDRLWRDRQATREMGARARELAVTDYAPATHIDKILSTYNRIKRS